MYTRETINNYLQNQQAQVPYLTFLLTYVQAKPFILNLMSEFLRHVHRRPNASHRLVGWQNFVVPFKQVGTATLRVLVNFLQYVTTTQIFYSYILNSSIIVVELDCWMALALQYLEENGLLSRSELVDLACLKKLANSFGWTSPVTIVYFDLMTRNHVCTYSVEGPRNFRNGLHRHGGGGQ